MILKRALFMFVPATLMAFVLWVQTAAADLLQDTTLSCSDGTQLALQLDPAALTALSDAVAAITLYPAGDPPLACSLSQSSSLSWSTLGGRLLALLTPNEAAASGNPRHDYAVGGGQVVVSGACHNNFSLGAHVAADTLTTGIGGTLNVRVEPDPVCGFSGHVDSKVDCLQVSETTAGRADLTAVVTSSSGIYAVGYSPGTEISISVFDSGMPGGTGDALNFIQTSGPCNFQSFSLIPIDRGNISVHDA